ncbi:ABC transporter permease [Paenibacillus sp. GCM10027628]|uniref:ABC transporter permease n=1 Tax=Paenibacillus sp. GCM10027628 TaxID=3273413 RepID=UPI00363391B8
MSTATKRQLKKYKWLLLMTVPGIIYLFINCYLPMFGIVLAFKKLNYAKGIWGSEWVGFDNFRFLFLSPDAYIITRNTLAYNGVFIVINLILSVGVAILLNEIRNKLLSRFYQSSMLLPHLMSAVIVAYLAYAFLSSDSGFMNKKILPMFGYVSVSWYNEADYWPYIITLINIWKNVGFQCIIYLAAIIGIDSEYYEAARIDGASKWQMATRITLPLITPIIITMALLQISGIMRSDFGLFYQVPMNSGPLFSTTNTIDTFVYRSLISLGDVGMSSAAGLYQSAVCLVLILGANFVVRRINKNDALF